MDLQLLSVNSKGVWINASVLCLVLLKVSANTGMRTRRLAHQSFKRLYPSSSLLKLVPPVAERTPLVQALVSLHSKILSSSPAKAKGFYHAREWVFSLAAP